MNKVYGLAIILIAMIGMSFSVLTVSATSMSSETFEPGSVGTITLQVSNNKICSGATSSYIIDSDSYTVQAVELESYSDSYVEVYSDSYLGDIEPCGSISVDIPIHIKNDTPTGVYTIPLTLRAYYTSSSTKHYITRYTFLTIKVLSEPKLAINVSDSISEFDTIHAKIDNKGAKAISSKLVVGGGCRLSGISSLFIGDISKSKNIEIPVDCSSANDGLNQIMFNITYYDQLNNKYSKVITAPIYIKKTKAALDIKSKTSIISGATSDLTLVLSSNRDISDITLYFVDPSFTTTNETEISISNIQKGTSTTVTTPIYSNSMPGWKVMNVKASWKEGNVIKTKVFDVPIHLTLRDGINAYIGQINKQKNEDGNSISVVVSNLEKSDIYDVEISLKSDDLKFMGPSEKYIGKLTNDDFTMVQFKIAPKSVMDKYSVSISVKYKDAGGEWHTKIINRTFSIDSSEEEHNETPVLLIVAGVVVVGIVLWKYGRKSK